MKKYKPGNNCKFRVLTQFHSKHIYHKLGFYNYLQCSILVHPYLCFSPGQILITIFDQMNPFFSQLSLPLASASNFLNNFTLDLLYQIRTLPFFVFSKTFPICYCIQDLYSFSVFHILFFPK